MERPWISGAALDLLTYPFEAPFPDLEPQGSEDDDEEEALQAPQEVHERMQGHVPTPGASAPPSTPWAASGGPLCLFLVEALGLPVSYAPLIRHSLVAHIRRARKVDPGAENAARFIADWITGGP